MLYFDRIVVSKRIYVNKTRCHDLLMMFMSLSNIVILNIKDFDYHCIISGISKNEAINIMQNADLTKKVEHYKT